MLFPSTMDIHVTMLLTSFCPPSVSGWDSLVIVARGFLFKIGEPYQDSGNRKHVSDEHFRNSYHHEVSNVTFPNKRLCHTVPVCASVISILSDGPKNCPASFLCKRMGLPRFVGVLCENLEFARWTHVTWPTHSFNLSLCQSNGETDDGDDGSKKRLPRNFDTTLPLWCYFYPFACRFTVSFFCERKCEV